MSASWDKLHVFTPEQNIKIWQSTLETLDKELRKNNFGPNPNNLATKAGIVIEKYIIDHIKQLEGQKDKLDRI